MKKISRLLNLISNMGIKPIAYRALHVFFKKTGLLKRNFPSSYTLEKIITLAEWRKSSPPFFFNSKEDLKEFILEDKKELKTTFQNLQNGQLKYFNGALLKPGNNYDWISNPDNKFKYDINKHWTELETLSAEAGDIKYVWEKSRFCYLYTIIRYDYHFKKDQSEYVFKEIISWIDSNPLNMGPNYTCSQELAIRMHNWIFALYYYKNSSNLTEERFQKIILSIYGQTHHVANNLNFSLLTVRNNHAITECLLLYTIGLLFPFFKESKEWKKKGKKLLEQEGLYQIYDDGSYLQFSMNYERVVIQLFTWAFYLSKINKDAFPLALEERLSRAVNFLYQHQDESTGMLPNYGANDGALFFQLNSCHFRDYRPQINALHFYLKEESLYEKGKWNEDIFWFTNKINFQKSTIERKTKSFETGGYYLLRDKNKFSFIRCGNHKDRPSQADNLHLDIWYEEKNILRDVGSYKYNSKASDIKYFMGTSSHNTVMIEDYDQMEKGGRFMWYYWSQAEEAEIENHNSYQVFTGRIHAFNQIKKEIIHTRKVRQYKDLIKWEIEDTIQNNDLSVKQIWNISPEFIEEGFEIICVDQKGNIVEPKIEDAFYSPTYGVKERSKQIIFESGNNYFKTTIFKK